MSESAIGVWRERPFRCIGRCEVSEAKVLNTQKIIARALYDVAQKWPDDKEVDLAWIMRELRAPEEVIEAAGQTHMTAAEFRQKGRGALTEMFRQEGRLAVDALKDLSGTPVKLTAEEEETFTDFHLMH